MPSDYKFFHGALLQEVIATAGVEVRIKPKNLGGRADAYIFNGNIGLVIKHSTARLSPWQFTFFKEHSDEIRQLRALTKECFVGLVCNRDGFACLRAADLMEILRPSAKEVASLRVERRPRGMYRVSSSGFALDRRVAKGVHPIIEEITQQSTGYAPPSSVTLGPSSLSEPADIA